MKESKRIRGAFGGGADSAPTPIEKKDTLFSTQRGRVLDLISEGPIWGLVTGDARSIYLDETPLLPETFDSSRSVNDPVNRPNFRGVRYAVRNGTPDQTYIPEFSEVETPLGIGVQIKKIRGHDPVPVTRSSTTPGLDAVILNLRIGPLFKVQSDGGIKGTLLEFRVSISTNGGPFVSVLQPVDPNVPPLTWPAGVGSGGWLSPSSNFLTAEEWAKFNEQLKAWQLEQGFTGNVPNYFTINGKTTSGYGKSIRIPLPPGTTTYSIKIEKLTDDPWDTKRGNTLYLDSLVEVIDSKFSYPHSAIIGVEVNADAFSAIPKRTYWARGIIVDVPSNRDNDPGHWSATLSNITGTFVDGEQFTIDARSKRIPHNQFVLIGPTSGRVLQISGTAASLSFDDWGPRPISGQTIITGLTSGAQATLNDCQHLYRTYTGDWDGTFVQAWTDNPAWLLYAALTNKRWGMGEFFPAENIDRWGLYRIGRYCDELVPDMKGGQEPRFALNAFLQNRQEAFDFVNQLSSVFRGMVYWAAGFLLFTQDRPATPIHQFTGANVVDGIFQYTGSSRRARHTVALVRWNNPDDMDRPAVEYVEDQAGLLRYGPNEIELTAFGCRSQGQARRAGRWILATENEETEGIGFSTGLEGALLRPGELFEVVDPNRGAQRNAGRLRAYEPSHLHLDRAVTLDTGIAYQAHVQMPATSEDLTAPENTTTLTLANIPTSLDPTQMKVWVDLDHDGEIDISLGNDALVQIVSFNPATKQLTIVAPAGTSTPVLFRVHYAVAFEVASVVSPAGSSDELLLAAPLAAIPPANGIWMLVAPNKTPRVFRCVGIRDDGEGKFAIAGMEYIEAKFAQVENDDILQSPEPAYPASTLTVTQPGEIIHEQGMLVTPTGAIPKIDLTWAPSTGNVVGYDVKYRFNFGNWVRMPRCPGPEIELLNTPAGVYDVEVYAVGPGTISGPRDVRFTTNPMRLIDVVKITGLELELRGNSDEFGGRDARFNWNVNLSTLSVEIGDDSVGADTTTLPPWFDGFILEVWDKPGGNWRLRRTEHIWDAAYVYTHEKNHEDSDRLDGPGSPATREGWTTLRGVDTFGNQGDPVTKHWINYPPGLPPMELAIGPAGITAKWLVPADLDLVGIIFWRSTDPAVPLLDENIIYRGTANPVIIAAEPGVPYYYRWGLYDGFEIYPTQVSDPMLAQVYSPGDPPPPPAGDTLWTQSPDPWTLDENSGWSNAYAAPTYYSIFYLPTTVLALDFSESKTITFVMDFALPGALPAGVYLQVEGKYKRGTGSHLLGAQSLFPKQTVTLEPDHTAHVERVGVMTASMGGDYTIEVRIYIWNSWSYKDMTFTNGLLKKA